ncbi:pyridoxal-phosphate dependent enzyme [Pseudomonas sediminis]|uniref:1-aminocyclopropane-1-carboxylate deaminase/D-cysteine desulfhydrase n=1 Tax=Pseudomonas sediminis TaxID=1691904 RepID=UPI00244D5B3D|nr:pyridoxal-phosphate dependent enzyme [Pseudomonas sediminis]MDG9757326.1 pyridoxal-phosphate dependent enzyme [Pseudomonas sediminis]
MPVRIPTWRPRAPLQPLQLDWLEAAGVELACLRLDLVDPLLSGNKWFKLVPYLEQAAADGAQGVISLGGAHSNHLHALAAAGQRFGFASVGLLRGEVQQTPTVDDLQRMGMTLHWLGYGGYRARHQPDFWVPWLARYPNFQVIGEGGLGLQGASGCSCLVAMAEAQLADIGWSDFDAWWLATGTGTTLAGLLLGDGQRSVFGAQAVPNDHGVATQVATLLDEAGASARRYQLIEAARGGFARIDEPLRQFILETEQACGVPLEPVYTGKALMALRDFCEQGQLARGTRLIFIHTGGLQGRRVLMGASADYTQV